MRPWKAWRPIEKATMAYGYGLSASLFQMARAYSVFAHDGVMMPITLVQDNMADASGRLHPVDKSRGVRVYSPAVAREILGHCGLEYEPGCTDLTRNRAPSATLSMPQVREPIHTRSFEEWRPYATQLAGLRQALGKP